MYTPKRDYRFEYVHDVVAFIEIYQCETCRFRKDDEDIPMCVDIEMPLMMEEPVDALDDRGSDGVICTKYREGDPADFEVDPNQLGLF